MAPTTAPLPAAPALPPAPASVIDHLGRPLVGAYQGLAAEVSWERAAGRVRRTLAGKRWHYVSISGPRCLFAVAIVDLGWVANTFTYLFDRDRRAVVVEHGFTGLPSLHARVARRPAPGAASTWRSPKADFALEQAADGSRWRIRARAPGLEVDASLATAGAQPTLCAIAEITGGVGNCTHKTHGLLATGTASAGGQRYELDGYVAGFDHTSGVLARDTRWRWASAARPGLALNLVEGFNGPVENVLWVGDKIVPAGAARFELDRRDPMRPWRITSDGGVVDLEFQPQGMRQQHKDLVVAKSLYVQPCGVFRGTIRPGGPGSAPVTVEDLFGVTEDHEARW